MVAAGVAAPVARKRLKTPPIVAQTVAFAAPVALCVAMRRTRLRDAAACGLQMWAYLAAYKSPHDDPEAQASRTQMSKPHQASAPSSPARTHRRLMRQSRPSAMAVITVPSA